MFNFVAHATLTLLLFSSTSSAAESASPFDKCPIKCSKAGIDPRQWTHLHGERALQRCQEPILFDTAIFSPVDDPNTHITLRSCTASDTNTTQEMDYNPAPFTFGRTMQRRQFNESRGFNESTASNNTLTYTKLGKLEGCSADIKGIRNQTDVHILQFNNGRGGKLADRSQVSLAVQKLKDYLRLKPDCESTTMLAQYRDAVVGLHVGKQVVNADADAVVDRLIKAVESGGQVSALASEICREDAPAAWTVGVYANFRGSIPATQAALAQWINGTCLNDYETKSEGEKISVTFIQRSGIPQAPVLLTGLEQISKPASLAKRHNHPHARSHLTPRDTCRYMKADGGDSCWSLSQECGISQADFVKYNPGDNFCNLVKKDQYVCCDKGDLPDFTPKPNGDGSCATHQVGDDDNCWKIADANFLTTAKLNEFNKNTWGWAGCDQLQPGQKICMSKGAPPMPAPVENALCGPTVPGTQRPTNDTEFKDLNPCPLNVCCNVWGQCGLTDSFCVEAPADTGAPGTSKPGANGCVSSCGMNITNNDSPPAQFRRIGYFEAWNHNRPCLHMDVTDIDTEKYTHVHFAFPDITPDFKPDVSKLQEQFDMFKEMKGPKRIVSFGGWAFSTEGSTFNIFRDGVTDANRLTLANNIAAFINEHGLDGVDFDWEYPSAPDIPDIPAGAKEAGRQYLEFLKIIKRRLSNKEVAIAAPSSYWYLKGMPIKEISEIVDYFVFMTYDLHGQWDYDNKWSTEGCPEGNCLRSHVNSTETRTSLAMVTKAGVKANKVIVGIASYGRSFHMAEEGCTGPDCHYTGTKNESDAMAGRCTNTSGYISNAEIRDIIAQGANSNSGYNLKKWYDAGSDSDMIVYYDTEWVAYMSDTTKQSRTNWYKGLNFGGTSDWAIDLDKDYGGDIGDGDLDAIEKNDGPEVKCDDGANYKSLEDISNDVGMDSYCAQIYTMNVLIDMFEGSVKKYHDVDNGYDEKFDSYAKYMKEGLPDKLHKYTNWLTGDANPFFDCHFVGNGKDWRGQCPVPRNIRGNLLVGIWDLEMTLRDKDGFYKDLGEKTGILEDWVRFGESHEDGLCNPTPCNRLELTIQGRPLLKDNFKIPDPKDVVKAALSNTGNLEHALNVGVVDLATGQWTGGATSDVVTALSVPVFMVQNAIQGMEDAKRLGDDIEKEEAKKQLLFILSMVFMVVPFVGEAAAVAAGFINVGRLIALAGFGANLGLTIRDVVENPNMAPFAIMDVLTAGRLKTPKQFSNARAFRTAMKDGDVALMGAGFQKSDSMVQKIVNVCRR